jgi:hypothetical protein
MAIAIKAPQQKRKSTRASVPAPHKGRSATPSKQDLAFRAARRSPSKTREEQYFFYIFRFYGPQKSVFDKTFKLPDVTKVTP